MLLGIILAIVVIVLVVLLYVFHVKTVWKVIGTIVGFILLVIFLAMAFTANLTKSASNLFNDVKAGNIEQAYTQTAKEFKASTTLDQFKTFLTQTTLDKYESAMWNERESSTVDGMGTGLLRGTVKTAAGKLPLEINLVKEDGVWKIYAMMVPQTGTGTTE